MCPLPSRGRKKLWADLEEAGLVLKVEDSMFGELQSIQGHRTIGVLSRIVWQQSMGFRWLGVGYFRVPPPPPPPSSFPNGHGASILPPPCPLRGPHAAGAALAEAGAREFLDPEGK